MTEQQNLNQILFNNSENKKENKLVLYENIPEKPIDFPNIEVKYSKNLNKALMKIQQRKPKDLGSIFDYSKKINIRKTKKNRNDNLITDFYNKNKDKDEYNLFFKEDNLLEELMTQFRNNKIKDKIPKVKRKQYAFNRLYDITSESSEKIKNIKKSKTKYSLDEYQEKIIKIVDTNSIEQSKINKLIQNLNELKDESNKVKALPPINVKAIREHFIKNKKIGLKKKSVKDIMNKNEESLDEFEKEEKKIKNSRYYKSRPKNNRNKYLDVLPEYIKEIFTKKLNYHH